jgi:hypothetical protein
MQIPELPECRNPHAGVDLNLFDDGEQWWG